MIGSPVNIVHKVAMSKDHHSVGGVLLSKGFKSYWGISTESHKLGVSYFHGILFCIIHIGYEVGYYILCKTFTFFAGGPKW